jgi:hypothetical protein
MHTPKMANSQQRALAGTRGVSRKLLARKATQTGRASVAFANPLESSFPNAAVGGQNGQATSRRNRSRSVDQQILQLGQITPNPETILATIVAMVAERGVINRGDLLTAMRSTSFPHPAARPADKSWCQGYVAGAIRNGFLAVAKSSPAKSDDAEDGTQEV